MKVSRRTAAKTLLAGVATGLALPARTRAAEAMAQDAAQERLRTEVCVLGGGSAGTAAALAAASAGAKVVLIECESILGGTSTNAWVHTWEPTSGADGIPREIYEGMKQDPLGVTVADYGRGTPRRGGSGLPFEPRVFNYTVREMLEATGNCITLLGTTFFKAHRQNDRLTAIEAWFPGKRLRIEAGVFIDSTADGDVCVDAGCEYHMGEDPKSLYSEPSAPEKAEMSLNGLTLCYRITDTGVSQKPYLPKGVKEGICPKPVHIVQMPNGPYGVPYRCLLPRGVENLYIASRAASFSHIAASSCRLCRTMMTLGQAAGNAAAIAAKHRLATRQIDVAKLQTRLRAQRVAISV